MGPRADQDGVENLDPLAFDPRTVQPVVRLKFQMERDFMPPTQIQVAVILFFNYTFFFTHFLKF